MEPSPWRCRRTDGKKWRCSKDVVPDQKYCERHMHRGSQRSRKPVEVFQSAALSNTAVPYSSENSNANISITPPVDLKLMAPLCTVANHTVTVVSIGELNGSIAHSKDKDVTIAINSGIGIVNNDTERNNRGIIGDGDNRNHVARKAIMGRSLGLSFSPNSVLQEETGCSSSSSIWYYSSKVEGEPGRCRRTDGKKWRCRKDVIPDQKYCERHMHRGAKKPATMLKRTTCAAPNTNLSISIRTSPQIANFNENGSSSSSGDTTITDDSVTASENGTVVL